MSILRIPKTESLVQILNEIFSDEFMAKHTNFQTFAQFRYSSAVFVSWDAAELIYDEDNMDRFVRESTQFKNWDEMTKTAADLRYQTGEG